MTARRGVLILTAAVLTALIAGGGWLVIGAGAQSPPPRDVRGHDAWRRAMQALRVPGRGCFNAASPTVQWVRVACVKAPNRPYEPAHGHRPFTVGGGNTDFSARSSGHITGAEGSF